jgi:ubiquitin-conjugating enzyme E2 I
MASGIAKQRLLAERKQWRKDKPFGFFARPDKNVDGSINIFRWICGIPGKKETAWEGGVYPLTLEFSEEYPAKPPKCSFDEGFYHPNVYPSGRVCLSIVDEDIDWRPAITVKQILTGIQDLLDTPNPKSPAQRDAYMVFVRDRNAYERACRVQAQKYRP